MDRKSITRRQQILNMKLFLLMTICVYCQVVKGDDIFPLTGGKPVTRGEDKTGHKVTLPAKIKFPFMGTIYENLYVSKDGLVGFAPGTLHQTEILTETLTKEDPAFAAPYYFSAQDIGSNLNGKPYTGNVLYRTTDSDILAGELSNYSSIIQESMVGLENQFEASYALVVTWKDVISKTDVLKGCSTCMTNTFQLAMLTDGTASFAIFNYVRMNITPDKFTQSGFNAGEGRGYTTALNSGQLQYPKSYQGSDTKGRYIYRIDGEQVQHGGCSTANRGGVLNIYPAYAGMLGGKMLDISGPCIQRDASPTQVKCRFGGREDLVTYGYKVNLMKARCSVPRMSIRGWITVEVSIDQRPYSHSTKILIVNPGKISGSERLQLPYMGQGQGWNETATTQLTLKWNSSLLTDNGNANLDISLMGYKENSNGVTWHNLRNIGSIRAAAGQFTFQTSSITCIGSICDEYEIGVVMAELQDQKQATFYRFIISKLVPLGFFVNNAMVMKLGENWPSQKCKMWHDKDKQDMGWLNDVESCPCTLVQALSDIGRFYSDAGCYLYDNRTSKCRYHEGSVHCVRSVQPTKSGAGNQCCYDANGNLRYAADSFRGSTPDKSHGLGAAPFGRLDLVPDMSHWVLDIASLFQCCMWTDYKDCDYYMDRRPTIDCKGYSPPMPAMIFGQGHIETFDGMHQRMCGHGDFLLMNTTLPDGSVVTVQGRFYENVFPEVVGERGNTSVMLTNVGIRVVRGRTTETVEIRLKLPTADRSERYLDVLVNQQYHFFDNKQSYWQDFKSFTVVNTDETGKEANFTVILKQYGLAVQIADCDKTLCVLVVAPPSFKGKVQGLLGNFNGNATDDLLYVNYTITEQMKQDKLDNLTLYQYFKYPWATPAKESVLPMYVAPSYDPPICSVDQPTRRPLLECDNNEHCLFDYIATGGKDIALRTKSMSMRIHELRHFLTPVRSCGLLNVPRSVKSNTNYLLDQTVTIQSCRQGHLQGDDTTYTCSATSETTQTWSPSVIAKCSATVETADTGMIVGIVVAVLIFIIILAVVVVVVRRRKNREYDSSKGQYGAPKEEETVSYSRPQKPTKEPTDEGEKKQEYTL
ncbi:sushi domain-containing protein 2-like isoform X2 [Mytilus edulis]|uniref:sushi domain-containing protein 2-like isoform X2 n=1 Tax=Mytilus edulis TaxID=6550 RepID=UPI0039F0FBB8